MDLSRVSVPGITQISGLGRGKRGRTGGTVPGKRPGSTPKNRGSDKESSVGDGGKDTRAARKLQRNWEGGENGM